MRGVLRYKWEAYCDTNGRSTEVFPFPESPVAAKAVQYKLEAYCNTKLEVNCSTFWSSGGWGFWHSRRRTNVQTNVQHRFVLFFLLYFLLFCSPWAKTLGFKGESPFSKKVWKCVRKCETILPFSCCPLIFLWSILRWGTSWWPQPPRFSQKYCDTNARRIAIQMGGILRYKWEEYWSISLSWEPSGSESCAIQTGGLLQYKIGGELQYFLE